MFNEKYVYLITDKFTSVQTIMSVNSAKLIFVKSKDLDYTKNYNLKFI